MGCFQEGTGAEFEVGDKLEVTTSVDKARAEIVDVSRVQNEEQPAITYALTVIMDHDSSWGKAGTEVRIML